MTDDKTDGSLRIVSKFNLTVSVISVNVLFRKKFYKSERFQYKLCSQRGRNLHDENICFDFHIFHEHVFSLIYLK